MNRSVRTMAEIALMAAVMCILGPLSVPIGPVPVSLTPFAVFLAAYLIGAKNGTIAVLIYLIIGAAGLPVFSGFSGGFAKLAGSTGGYLIGFIFMALIAGFFIEKFYDNIPVHVAGMILGLAVLYVFGTAWLAHQAGMSFKAALAAGVIPFIAVDLIKLAAAVVVGRAVRSRLMKAGVIRPAGKLLSE